MGFCQNTRATFRQYNFRDACTRNCVIISDKMFVLVNLKKSFVGCLCEYSRMFSNYSVYKKAKCFWHSERSYFRTKLLYYNWKLPALQKWPQRLVVVNMQLAGRGRSSNKDKVQHIGCYQLNIMVKKAFFVNWKKNKLYGALIETQCFRILNLVYINCPYKFLHCVLRIVFHQILNGY